MKKTEEKRNNITEAVFILDRSGSMGGLETDTIGGFNSMIEKQKKQEGEAYVTTVLFDGDVETLHDRIPVAEVAPLTEKDYYVRGCTALLDAIGMTVEHIEKVHRYQRREDVPENTVFVITTDGLENASRKFDSKTVKKLIEKKKEEGWEFLFIGANIDAVETAAAVGIGADRAVNYHADACGTAVLFEAVSEAIEDVRCRKPLKATWGKKITADYDRRK